MADLTINLSLPLTGLNGVLYYTYFDGSVWQRQFMFDLPVSVDGVVFASYSEMPSAMEFVAVFPSQTISGVTYMAAETEHFTLDRNVIISLVIDPVTEPEPPVPPMDIKRYVAPLLFGFALMGVILRQ